MASFQVKIDWEWPRKRENKRNRSEEFLPYKQQKIKKKKSITASFQAKMSWETLRKRKNK